MSPTLAQEDDVFGGPSSHLQVPSNSAPRRSPSKQNLNKVRSSTSLRSSSLSPAGDEDVTGGGRQHSLAHELAAALMPEPSAGSKLLAEEFGIDYDEGAEGIDDSNTPEHQDEELAPPGISFADELGGAQLDSQSFDPSFGEAPASPSRGLALDDSSDYGSPLAGRSSAHPTKDPVDILAQDVVSTDAFLRHLRSIDAAEAGSTIEELALEVVRRMDENARDREGQVRQLFQFDREFKQLSGEIGGMDLLGGLDALEKEDEAASAHRLGTQQATLETLEEEPASQTATDDWEVDPHSNHLGDDDDDYSSSPLESPTKVPLGSSIHTPLTRNGATATTTSQHLSQFRTFTASLMTSLSTISEQVQVNGQAASDAGRKIRALKNKLGSLQSDVESLETSVSKIEKWEAVDRKQHMLDGRAFVQEQLKAFEQAIMEAGMKTQAIMAR